MNLSDLDPAEVKAVSQPTQTTPAPSATPLNLSDLDPNEVSFVANNPEEAKYGTVPQQALAGVEATARGGTLGASDLLEQQLAKYNPQLFGPEAVRGRERAQSMLLPLLAMF